MRTVRAGVRSARGHAAALTVGLLVVALLAASEPAAAQAFRDDDLAGTYRLDANPGPTEVVVKRVRDKAGRFVLTDAAGDWQGLRLPDQASVALTAALESLLEVEGKLPAPLPASFLKPGALVFARAPSAREMGEKIPEWARLAVERQLLWVMVLEPSRGRREGKPAILLS